jgi:hypothetical protein
MAEKRDLIGIPQNHDLCSEFAFEFAACKFKWIDS